MSGNFVPRRQYAEIFGPTVGDRIRLADTDLWIQIERDTPFTATRSRSAAAR